MLETNKLLKIAYKLTVIDNNKVYKPFIIDYKLLNNLKY